MSLTLGDGILFTGDARIDFSLVESQIFHDPGNKVQDIPEHIHGETTDVFSNLESENLGRSGWDIRSVFFYYDMAVDTLHVGLHCYGICGDADGDGDADVSSPELLLNDGIDYPGLNSTEYLAIYLDSKNYGAYSSVIVPEFHPELIIGTPEILDENEEKTIGGEGYDGFNVYHYSEETIYYGDHDYLTDALINFSSPLTSDNPLFGLVDPMKRDPILGDIEFSIRNFSNLPGMSWNTSILEYPDGQGGTFKPFNTMRFSFALAFGSSGDSSIGSDFIPELNNMVQPGITVKFKCPYDLDMKDKCCPQASKDSCNVCFGNGSDMDYCGVCFGANSLMDSCGDCSFGSPDEKSCPAAAKSVLLIDVQEYTDITEEDSIEVIFTGDLDNNGYEDILLGVPGKDCVYIFYMGESHSVIDVLQVTSPSGNLGSQFGFSLLDIGKTENDAYMFSVGAPLDFDGKGSVYLFFAYTNKTITSVEVNNINDDLLKGFGSSITLIESFPKLTLGIGAPSSYWSGREDVTGKIYFVYLRGDGETISSWPLHESEGILNLINNILLTSDHVNIGEQITALNTYPITLASKITTFKSDQKTNLLYRIEMEDTMANLSQIPLSNIPLDNLSQFPIFLGNTGDIDRNGIFDLIFGISDAPTRNISAKGLVVTALLNHDQSIESVQMIGGGYGRFLTPLPEDSVIGSSVSYGFIKEKSYLLTTSISPNSSPKLVIIELNGQNQTSPPIKPPENVVIIPPTHSDVNITLPKAPMPPPGPPIIVEHPNYIPDFRIRPERLSNAYAAVSFEMIVEREGSLVAQEIRFPKMTNAYVFTTSDTSSKWVFNGDSSDGFSYEIETSLFEEEALIQLLNSERVFRIGKNSYKWTFTGHRFPFDKRTNELEIYMRVDLSTPVLTSQTKNYKEYDEEVTRIVLSTVDSEVRISLPHLAIVDDSILSYVTPELRQMENEILLVVRLPHFSTKILYDPDITIIDISDIEIPSKPDRNNLKLWHFLVIGGGVLFIIVLSIIIVVVCSKRRKKMAKAEKNWKLAANSVDNNL